MKFKLKKFLPFVAGGLAIIAFFMAFVSPLKNVVANADAPAMDIWFGNEIVDGTILPFIGFVLALVSGAYLIVRQFIKVPNDKIFFWVAIGLLVVSAVLVLLTKTFFVSTLAKDFPKDFRPEAIKMYDQLYGLNIGAILGGVFAILSAVWAVVEKFIKK